MVSTIVVAIIENRILPTEGLVGHDFSYFMPYLLAGVQWIHLNGWTAVPYFTPDFCGGIPWLANPQSIFYSVPQVLGLLTDFVTASKLTAVIFTTIGAVATYALCRQCFRTSWQAAALASTLFQLNGFLIFRIGIGHLTYHVFGLVPIIAWCVLYFSDGIIKCNARSFTRVSCSIAITGCLLAIMVYGGAINYIIPAVLSVSGIILLQQALTSWCWTPWIIFGGGAVWSIFLSALKLNSAFVFASDYPRALLHRHLFANPLRMIWYLLRSLFVPESLPSFIYMSGDFIGLHELEFGVSVVPALLIVAAFVAGAKQMKRPQHPFIVLMLALIIAIPIIATVGPEVWGKVLERVPIVNNNTTLTRWYSIYILPVIVLTALSFDRIVHSSRAADLTLAVCVLLASLQLLSRDLTYYTSDNNDFQLYNPAPVTAEARRILSGGLPRPITEVGPPSSATSPMNALLWGRSALPCYEPLFGYSLEMFPAGQLRPGPITDPVAGDSINMADPRCYLARSEKSCVSGHSFRSEDISDVLAFASHQPLHWHKPVWQKVAEFETLVSLSLSASMLLASVVVGILRFVGNPFEKRRIQRHNA
jgi:hypothetical protein